MKIVYVVIRAAAVLISIPIVVIEGCMISHKYTPAFICVRRGKWAWSK